MSATIIRLADRGRPFRLRPVEGWFESEMRAALERVFSGQLPQRDGVMYDDRRPADTEQEEP